MNYEAIPLGVVLALVPAIYGYGKLSNRMAASEKAQEKQEALNEKMDEKLEAIRASISDLRVDIVEAIAAANKGRKS